MSEQPKLATAMSIGKQLCEALGLDNQRVVGLHLIAHAGQPVQVIVTRYITEAQGLAVVQLLTQRFELVEMCDPAIELVKPADAARNQANAVAAASAARAQLDAQQPGGTEREAARARIDRGR